MGASRDLLTLPGGRRVQVWEGGDPSGRAVVFFHGCPDTRRAAFSGAAEARRLGVRLVAVNRPGYGASDAAESGHLSVAHDTAAVADRLAIDEFSVLGMSVGGPYALACAALHPDRVRSAAVVSAPGMTVEMDPPWARDDPAPDQRELFARIASSTVAEAVELVRPDFAEFVARVDPQDPDDAGLARRWTAGLHPLDAGLLAALSPEEVAASVREALAQHEGYLRDAAVTFRAWEFRPETVACPTSLRYGALDENHPVRNGRWLADHIPGATLTVLDGTSHLGALVTGWADILDSLS